MSSERNQIVGSPTLNQLFSNLKGHPNLWWPVLNECFWDQSGIWIWFSLVWFGNIPDNFGQLVLGATHTWGNTDLHKRGKYRTISGVCLHFLLHPSSLLTCGKIWVIQNLLWLLFPFALKTQRENKFLIW